MTITTDLSDFMIPTIRGYNPDFGTMKENGGLSPMEIHNNISYTLRAQWGIPITENSRTTQIRRDTRFVIREPGVTLTLGSGQDCVAVDILNVTDSCAIVTDGENSWTSHAKSVMTMRFLEGWKLVASQLLENDIPIALCDTPADAREKTIELPGFSSIPCRIDVLFVNGHTAISEKEENKVSSQSAVTLSFNGSEPYPIKNAGEFVGENFCAASEVVRLVFAGSFFEAQSCTHIYQGQTENAYYSKSKNGDIMQRGNFPSNTNVVFPIPFSDNLYHVATSYRHTANYSENAASAEIVSVQSFKHRCSKSNVPCQYIAYGR